ncbi:hypothetical protein BU15DRAFT_84714 [Melanogaster broomeanus]|nr:hypothetical protein BU15DRAFT_84714 [Melanogaster broomeanus]
MPRLLPRLLKTLKEASLTNHSPRHVDRSRNVSSPRRNSLYHPLPASLPSFNLAGRTRSILLDKNPVTDKEMFTKHKSLPQECMEMTVEEREWFSSPYLRMLRSPLRQCVVSRRYLPSGAFLFLRSNRHSSLLAPLRLPVPRGTRAIQVLMPDGIEHPKFKRRQAHSAVYATCWEQVAGNIDERGPISRHTSNLVISKHLCMHISYLLRLRILQEIEVLIDALKVSPRLPPDLDSNSGATTLRRLSRSEFKAFRETGLLPYPDAAAVLVVPPVNRDPKTKLRPQPSQEPQFPSAKPTASLITVRKKTLPPLSTLHDVNAPGDVVDNAAEMTLSNFIPNVKVPLYNGVAMFPSPPHRAALHNLLCKLLDKERHLRSTRSASEQTSAKFNRAKGDEKGSHAFLLTSNEQTVKRADTVPLAIALWRLRMWEGDAFSGDDEGWEVEKEWRIKHASR